jgi:hypothetical protein
MLWFGLIVLGVGGALLRASWKNEDLWGCFNCCGWIAGVSLFFIGVVCTGAGLFIAM